jgi:transposase
MNGVVTLRQQDQIRAMTLNRVLEGALTGVQAAAQLDLSVRQLRRLLAAYRAEGAAAIPHGNRGRPPAHAVAAAVRERVAELSRTAYAGANDSHLRDLLEEREGIALSLSTVRRIRRAAGEPSPRQRRAPAHRQRRERRPQAGMLLQLDGSPHAWLEERGPRLSLLAAIDDATGAIAGAVWRAREDSLGYLELLEQIVTEHGRPEAVYHDRSGIFVHHAHERETLAEQLDGGRMPRQVERAFAALGIASITAHSPQAKGRVERLFNTLQDRLVVELRLAGARTQAEAGAVLAAYLPRFNAAFAVPAAVPGSAYRPLAPGADLRQVCCLTERRVVANDDTIQVAGQRLQLLPGRERRTHARATVEVRQHLDGTLSVWRGDRELAWQPAPADARARRAGAGAAAGAAGGRARPPAAPAAFNLEAEDRAELAPAPAPPPPAPAPAPGPRKPAPNHAWRAGFNARRVTFSQNSSGDRFTG